MLKILLGAGLALGTAAAVSHGDQRAAAVRYRAPVALVTDLEGERLFVAEEGEPRLSIVDLGTATVVSVVPLPDTPSGLALSHDGAELYVTVGVADGGLVVIDTRELELTRHIALGNSPISPVVAADGRTLWFCNRFTDAVGSVDLVTGEMGSRIPAARQPIACALTADGATLVVATHLPLGPADGDYTAAEVLLVDTSARSVRARIELPNGSTSLRHLCLSPDGRHALVPHILARYHHPATQLERGWVNTNALSVVDLREERLLTTVLLDAPEHGAANPWGVACTPDGESVVVTHAGSHAISVVDLSGLLDKLRELDGLEDDATVRTSDDLSFLEGLRRRVDLAGIGPRDAIVSGDRVYAVEYFSGSIGVVDLEDEQPRVRSIALGPEQPISDVRRGEMLFHDAKICFQEWQSCSSCHPDGRSDGFNWDLMNDGFGNPKNTKSLLLAHRTPPTTATGIRANAELSVRSGVHHIHFTERPESESVALDVYLSSMQPVPSPWLEEGELSASARAGREVFVRAECDRCHPAPLYTDLGQYDLGNTRGPDQGHTLDTPTLVEVWRNAPYLHDGRAADLLEVLVEHNRDDRHGRTSELSPTELADLVEYVRSL